MARTTGALGEAELTLHRLHAGVAPADAVLLPRLVGVCNVTGYELG